MVDFVYLFFSLNMFGQPRKYWANDKFLELMSSFLELMSSFLQLMSSFLELMTRGSRVDISSRNSPLSWANNRYFETHWLKPWESWPWMYYTYWNVLGTENCSGKITPDPSDLLKILNYFLPVFNIFWPILQTSLWYFKVALLRD